MICVNSWYSSGTTWTDLYGHRHRLDYIGMTRNLFNCTLSCNVEVSIDLATAERDDHNVLVAVLNTNALTSCKGIQSLPDPRRNRRRLSRCLMSDPTLCFRFQRDLQEFVPPENCDVDGHLSSLRDFTKRVALRCFKLRRFHRVIAQRFELRRFQISSHRFAKSMGRILSCD